MARLFLHRRAARSRGKGQDPRPNPQDVSGQPRGRADPAQPDRARLDQPLPARRREAHVQHAGSIPLTPGDHILQDAALLVVEGIPSTAPRFPLVLAADHGGRSGADQPGVNSRDNTVSPPGRHYPHPLGHHLTNSPWQELRRARCSEMGTPGSRAAWRNGPVATPAPRSRPTQPAAGTGDEGAKFWMSVLTDLRDRGVADVFFLVCDGLKGLPRSLRTPYPESPLAGRSRSPAWVSTVLRREEQRRGNHGGDLR